MNVSVCACVCASVIRVNFNQVHSYLLLLLLLWRICVHGHDYICNWNYRMEHSAGLIVEPTTIRKNKGTNTNNTSALALFLLRQGYVSKKRISRSTKKKQVLLRFWLINQVIIMDTRNTSPARIVFDSQLKISITPTSSPPHAPHPSVNNQHSKLCLPIDQANADFILMLSPKHTLDTFFWGGWVFYYEVWDTKKWTKWEYIYHIWGS